MSIRPWAVPTYGAMAVAKGAGDYMTTHYLSHGQRVTRLYKFLCRSMVDNSYIAPSRIILPNYLLHRFNMMKIRKEFDNNKNVDMETAQKLLDEGEEMAKNVRYYKPFKYPHSPGGSCFNRVPFVPDHLLDTWHPLEKARYPKYFAQREIMKDEYIQWWHKKYSEEGTQV